MHFQAKQFRFRLRAAVLLLLFVFGWATVPIALAQPPMHGCTMECCEADGFCCCLESRREAIAAQPDADQLPQIDSLPKKCGENCATSPSVNSATSFTHSVQSLRVVSFVRTQSHNYQRRIEYQEYLRLKDSSPRAPPRFL